MNTLILLDIVHTRPVSVSPDCALEEAVACMNRAQHSSLLVMENDHALGIVTEHDLVRLLHYRTPRNTPVREIMSHPLLSAPGSMDINTAYAWLLNQNIRHLVVEDEHKHIVGVVSEQDFRRHMGMDVLRQLGQLDKILDKELPTLPPHASLGCALDLMLNERVSYVLVTEAQRPLGILTEQDIPSLLLKHTWQNPDAIRLEQVMTQPAPTTHAQQSIATIAALMQENDWQYVIITDNTGLIQGVITLHNLLGHITSTLLTQQLHEQQSQLENSLYKNKSRLNMIAEAAHIGFWELDLSNGQLFYSNTLHTLTGRDKLTAAKNLDEWRELIHEEDRPLVLKKLNAALYSEEMFDAEYRTQHAAGHLIWLQVRGQIVQHDQHGNALFAVGVAMDITERKHLEMLHNNERHLLELLGRGTALPVFLQQLASNFETLFSHTRCMVSRLEADGRQLRILAAPSFPEEFHAEHQFIAVGPDEGSCGRAAYLGKNVLVDDTATDPYWAKLRTVTERYQMRTAWAVPILSSSRKVLGTFTLYSSHSRSIHPRELAAIERAAHLAALAMEREQQQRALLLNKEILKRAQAVAEVGSWVCHFQRGDCQLSDEARRIFGLSAEQPVTEQMLLSDLIHEADRLHLAQAWQDALLGATFNVEHRILVHDEVRYVRTRMEIEFNPDGTPLRAIGTVQDFTERHKSREQMHLLAEAVEQSYNAVMITDLNANIQYVNAAFCATTGYERAEVVGRNPRLLKSSKTPAVVYANLWAHLAEGKAWRGELVNRRKDGSEYYDSTMISPVRQADGRITNYLAIKEDLSRLKAAEQNVQLLSNYDSLTGLPNRTLLTERVIQAIADAQHHHLPFALLFLDLDHFKNINDTLGHRIGDALLLELSNRLRMAVRKADTLSRTGGDEFILLLPETSAEQAAIVAEKILRALSQPCRIAQQELTLTASIGIAMYPENGNNFDSLGQCADMAMYRAKQNGRNTFRLFNPEMQSYSSRQMVLENALRHAIQRGQLCLHYQPQFHLHDHSLSGTEVLLRWQHPELGCISPAEFIPIAEGSGQILQIGQWVLDTALGQLRQWRQDNLALPALAVNLSALQFRAPNLPEQVRQLLLKHDIPPHLLELELTESVAMENPAEAAEIIGKLHQHGVGLSIDDFGTGYSSLSYLKRFKVHKLKIDQSFIHHILEDQDDRAIVAAVIHMAQSLGFQTLAEGVETRAQADLLQQHGCDQVQGYHFSHPLSCTDFTDFLRRSAKQ